MFNEDEESPFFGCVDWVNNRFPDTPRVVTPQAIENSVKALEKAFREYLREDDQDAIGNMMAVIWRAIKEQLCLVKT